MIKDPLDKTETPYDILGLAVNATPDEVHRAHQLFLRNPRNRPRINLAQDAVRKLRKPGTRAEIEIWMYPVDEPGAVAAGPEAAVDVAELMNPAPLADQALPMETDAEHWPAQIAALTPMPINAPAIGEWDELSGFRFVPEVDR